MVSRLVLGHGRAGVGEGVATGSDWLHSERCCQTTQVSVSRAPQVEDEGRERERDLSL